MGKRQLKGSLCKVVMSKWDKATFRHRTAECWRALFRTASRSASYRCVVRVNGGPISCQ